jgi:hypothetical protein
MSEAAQGTSQITVAAGLLTVLGGVLVLASIFVQSVVIAETTIDLYLWGGVIFAIGFAGGATLHLDRGNQTKAAAQVLGAAGWLLIVVGGSEGLTNVFFAGLVLLLVGGALLYEVPGRIADWLG